MRKKEKSNHTEKTLEICVDDHPVSLSFAAEYNSTVAQRVRACLIDSFIRQNGVEAHKTVQV